MELMNKNEFLDWVEENWLQDAYKVGDVYSDIPEMLGILYKDGMYRVYQVNERGTPEDIIDVQNEDEAYGYLQQCLMADHVRYMKHKRHEDEIAQGCASDQQELPTVIVPAAAALKPVAFHVMNPPNDDPILTVLNNCKPSAARNRGRTPRSAITMRRHRLIGSNFTLATKGTDIKTVFTRCLARKTTK